MKISILITALLLSTQILAISGKEFLSKIRSNYESLNSLNLEINYRLFKGLKGEDLREEYQSIYARIGKESYRKIGQTELINTNEFNLNINRETKQIIVTATSTHEFLDLSIDETLKWCKDIVVSKFNDKNEIRLILKDKTDIPYSSIYVKVDDKFWIEEITFLYSVQVDFSETFFDKKMDYPRLTVTYQKIKKGWKDKENLLESSNYICSNCDPLSGLGLYADFEIIDLRNHF